MHSYTLTCTFHVLHDVHVEIPKLNRIPIDELSPRSTQSISRATMSPTINALTKATVAAVIASVEEGTPVVPLQPAVDSLECKSSFETHARYLQDQFILQLWLVDA